jgi:hypothetical protein
VIVGAVDVDVEGGVPVTAGPVVAGAAAFVVSGRAASIHFSVNEAFVNRPLLSMGSPQPLAEGRASQIATPYGTSGLLRFAKLCFSFAKLGRGRRVVNGRRAAARTA